MKTIYSPEDLKTDSIVINLNDDTEIRIRINRFGELVVNKQYYGEGESGIIIVPFVSNEIKIK